MITQPSVAGSERSRSIHAVGCDGWSTLNQGDLVNQSDTNQSWTHVLGRGQLEFYSVLYVLCCPVLQQEHVTGWEISGKLR